MTALNREGALGGAFLAIALAGAILMSPAEARAPAKKEIVPGAAVEEQLQSHGQYTNARGENVHAPAKNIVPGGVPDGATARCGDGSYSFSHSRSGTCSRHGGVGGWLR